MNVFGLRLNGAELMRNVNYCHFDDRYASSWTLRLKGIYVSLRRNKVTKNWQCHIKRITDLDILGLYHEISWKLK
jgi:hypothetical protein